MPSADPIQGISFTSLVTNDNSKFQSLGNFYTALGFRLTKNYSKVSNNGAASASNNPKLHIGVSNDSLKEIWLESFLFKNWMKIPTFYHGKKLMFMLEITVRNCVSLQPWRSDYQTCPTLRRFQRSWSFSLLILQR